MKRRTFLQTLAAAAAAPAFAAPEPFRLRYVLSSAMYGEMPLDVILPEVAKAGCEAIDIWCKVHGNQREQIAEMGDDAFAALLKKHDVKLGVSTRYPLGPFGLADEMAWVKKLGGKIVLSGSKGPKDPEGEAAKDAVKKFLEDMKPHVAKAEELGVTIAIENHIGQAIYHPDSLRYFAEFNRSANLGIAFAPHHLFRWPDADSEAAPRSRRAQISVHLLSGALRGHDEKDEQGDRNAADARPRHARLPAHREGAARHRLRGLRGNLHAPDAARHPDPPDGRGDHRGDQQVARVRGEVPEGYRVMRAGAAAFVVVLLHVAALRAEPLVVAFDRFHAAKPSAEGGRLLFNELGCANCHGGETGLPARRGPDLVNVTQRLQPEWLKAFLANPSEAHGGTNMPHLLAQPEVEPVLHYLASLKPGAVPKAKLLRHVNALRGGELFHTVGCVACHAPGKDFQPPDGMPKESDFTHRSVAFPKLASKYALSTLADFIRDPLKVRADGRMPRTAMDEQDAVDIAGWLLNFEGSDGTVAPKIARFKADTALVERGRGIVASLRCAACHDLPKDVAVKRVPLKQTSGGCLGDAAVTGVPRYELSAPQREALRLFLVDPAEPASPANVASSTLEALNCLACHERDGRGGPDAGRKPYFLGDHNLGDTGRYAPPLTGAGRKLQPDWLAKVLTGEFRVRPYLQTKMPVYGAATATLGVLLAKADAKTETVLPGGDDTAGRKLMGTLGGLGCITCHRWGERASLGIQALDLSNLGQRIQPGWLREYLVNPAAYRAGTLMPSFGRRERRRTATFSGATRTGRSRPSIPSRRARMASRRATLRIPRGSLRSSRRSVRSCSGRSWRASGRTRFSSAFRAACIWRTTGKTRGPRWRGRENSSTHTTHGSPDSRRLRSRWAMRSLNGLRRRRARAMCVSTATASTRRACRHSC